jgi:flagellar export protein FliJ
VASFRFRAQAALDLRRREYDEAQRILAQAEAERRRAREQLDEAQHALTAARRTADEAAATPGFAADVQWYRFWILRLDQQRAAAASVVGARDAMLAEAHAACLRARVKCKALELFREKALLVYRDAEALAERKTIDELATRRFTIRRDANEGADL